MLVFLMRFTLGLFGAVFLALGPLCTVAFVAWMEGGFFKIKPAASVVLFANNVDEDVSFIEEQDWESGANSPGGIANLPNQSNPILLSLIQIVAQYHDGEIPAGEFLMETGLRALENKYAAHMEWGYVDTQVLENEGLVFYVKSKQLAHKLKKSRIKAGENAVLVVRVGQSLFYSPNLVFPGSLEPLFHMGQAVIGHITHITGTVYGDNVLVFANGFLKDLDAHNSLLNPLEYGDLKQNTQGIFKGFGFAIEDFASVPIIKEIVPGSSAHGAGFEVGDVILKYENSLLPFQNLRVLKNLMQVHDQFQVFHIFSPRSKTIKRRVLYPRQDEMESLHLAPIKGWDSVLYGRLYGFPENITRTFWHKYKDYQAQNPNIKHMILDLRGNPGGLLDEALKLSSLFLKPRLPLIAIRSRYQWEQEYSQSKRHIAIPLTLIVDSSSASASEIVAGIMKDHNRARIVGESTYGKGSVQSLFELFGQWALKLTVAHYFSPWGKTIQSRGVEPHVHVKWVQSKRGFWWTPHRSEEFTESNNDFFNKSAEKTVLSYDMSAFGPPSLDPFALVYPGFQHLSGPVDPQKDGMIRAALEDMGHILPIPKPHPLASFQQAWKRGVLGIKLGEHQGIAWFSNLNFGNAIAKVQPYLKKSNQKVELIFYKGKHWHTLAKLQIPKIKRTPVANSQVQCMEIKNELKTCEVSVFIQDKTNVHSITKLVTINMAQEIQVPQEVPIKNNRAVFNVIVKGSQMGFLGLVGGVLLDSNDENKGHIPLFLREGSDLKALSYKDNKIIPAVKQRISNTGSLPSFQ